MTVSNYNVNSKENQTNIFAKTRHYIKFTNFRNKKQNSKT